MWQKLIAASFVMMGACGFGYSICSDMSKTIAECKIQKQMLLYIIGEISYLHRPLEEIFDIISERLEIPFNIFLRNVATEMRTRNGRNLKSIWNNEVNNISAKYGISKQSKEYLHRMADCFECEGDMIQVETLELFKKEIDQKIEELLAQKRENSRLIKVLSALAGIMCIVIFV